MNPQSSFRSASRSVLLTAVIAAAPAVLCAVDAGLNLTFQNPAPTTGASLNVTASPYNATSNNTADNDATGIQAAINASSSGGEVYIPNGVYHLKSGLTLKTGVAIRGQSREGVILYAYSASDLVLMTAGSGRTDITLSNMTLSRGSTGKMLRGILVGTNSGTVCQRMAFKNIQVDNFENQGFMIYGLKWGKVENCIFRNATDTGGGGNGYGVCLSGPNNNNNWVTGNLLGPVIRHGVLIQFSAHHNLVENNVAFDNVEDAYDLHGEDEYSNELRYNLAFDCARGAFGVGNTGSTHYNSGPNNWIHDNDAARVQKGVEVINESDNTYIENNIFQDCTEAGVHAYTNGGDNLVISGNAISNSANGIYLADSLSADVLNNSVIQGSYGIRTTSNVTGYIITGNAFLGNTTNKSLGSASGTYSGNTEGAYTPPTTTTTTFTTIAAEDGFVRESSEFTGIGTGTYTTETSIQPGDDANDKACRGFYSFDTSSLPNTATIVRATLKLKCVSINGAPASTMGIQVADIAAPFGSSSALADEDFTAPALYPYAAVIPTTGITAGSTANVNFLKGALPSISLTGKTQIRIRFTNDDDDDASSDRCNWGSGNNTDATYQAKLEIEYY